MYCKYSQNFTEVISLKKLIAMAACATLVMSTVSVAADSLMSNNYGVDVVSAASGETTPAPAKPTTPKTSTSTKSTPSKSTPTKTSAVQPSAQSYADGFYSAYGDSSSYGSEKAEITIKNGKLADVKLYKLLPSLMDGQSTYYYKQAPQAAPVMAKKFLKNGTYFAEMTSADIVTGATSSSKNWNLAVSRALEKALTKSSGKVYFDGTFAGVDNQSKLLVLLTLQNHKITKVSSYILNTTGHVVIDSALTPAQKEVITSINSGLLSSGILMKDIKGSEYYTAAAKAAYLDALDNAYARQGKYKDGTFTAYGHTYDKGTNEATVTLRNGKIVDLHISRNGQNLVDRGETAYVAVVKAVPILKDRFMKAATLENVKSTNIKVDAVAGATASQTAKALVDAIDMAYAKAEINKTNKSKYLYGTAGVTDGVFPGTDAKKSVYVMLSIDKEALVPSKVVVYYLDAAGKVIAEDKLTADQKAVKAKIEASNNDAGTLHAFVSKPASFGTNDAQKGLSGRVIQAINFAVKAATR
jgi:uncharacterized protein with FMN-binding domain